MQRYSRILTLSIFVILLTGCTATCPTTSPTGVALQPSLTPLIPATATPAPTIEATLTPAPAGCTETNGQVQVFELASNEIGRPLAVRVYTPPCYDPAADRRYPVLYLLHGQSFNDDQWERLGVPETADRLIAAGEVAPFMVVMPQEYYYLQDMTASAFPSALVNEVLPWVEENFAACNESACRAIGGLSRGATWAAWIGYQSWPLFGAIGLHSLPTASIGNLRYTWLPAIPEDQRPRLYLDIGIKDPYYPYASEFESYLDESRVTHQWHLNSGGHDEEYWSAHVEEYLRWYAAGW
jgi:enterochelin esterase-like enzyme